QRHAVVGPRAQDDAVAAGCAVDDQHLPGSVGGIGLDGHRDGQNVDGGGGRQAGEASRGGGGQAGGLPAAQGVAGEGGGAAGAGYGLVHDAIAVPVDLEGEDGAGRVTGGREGEGQRLPDGAGGRAGDRGAGDHPDASLGVGQERVHRIGGGE